MVKSFWAFTSRGDYPVLYTGLAGSVCCAFLCSSCPQAGFSGQRFAAGHSAGGYLPFCAADPRTSVNALGIIALNCELYLYMGYRAGYLTENGSPGFFSARVIK